uniref:ShKT domain-containing protein n=1 Tax=Takifugu rubripes TaxID=31033 RepID=A0A674NU13_TAKRU
STMLALNFLCTLGLAALLTFSEDVAVSSILVSSSEKSEIVNKHNALRRSVQPSASNMLHMSWNSEAADNAQKWANTCSMKHSPDTSGCGENLYMSSQKNSWSDAIQLWYDEVKDWRYGVGSVNGDVVGHFTQVVWHRSNQVGCALAHCPNSKYKYFYVCHYCPPYVHSSHFSLFEAIRPSVTLNNQFQMAYSNCPELKQQWGCSNSDVASWCPASCKCTNEIV